VKYLSRRWILLILAAASCALGLKLFLAVTTAGSIDVAGFSDQLAKIKELGGIGAYHALGKFGNPLNHPPFMIHVIKAMGYMAEHTVLPFSFWLRLPATLADTGSLFLVWKILERSQQLTVKPATLLLMAACPASIMISGYHGNTDAVMMLFVLATVFLLNTTSPSWIAGLAFGMALNIKVAPLIFVPATFFYLASLKQRMQFFGAAFVVFLVGSMPYIAQDPKVITRIVFGYGSLYGNWGWTWFAKLWTNVPVSVDENSYQPTGIHATLATVGKYLMLAVIFALSWRMNRRRIKPHLFFQYGVVVFTFIALTPGFGAQYFAWVVPFVVALGFWPTVLFYLTSGLYLLIDYGCLAYASRQYTLCQSRRPEFYAGLACWYSVFAILMFYRAALKKHEFTAMKH
jgi:hypothetical protein